MQNNPLFDATLTPHRSLGPTGHKWVLGLYAAFSLIPALFFLMSGAWPIPGFLGLDGLLLYWALKSSNKSGRIHEQVTLWMDKLRIQKCDADGNCIEKSFNPFWTRVNLVRDFDDQITQIQVRNQGAEFEIGAFLNPEDKTSFALAFSRALKGLNR